VQEIGADGMIGGQAADVCGCPSESRTEKTTALMRLTMTAGAAAAGARSADSGILAAFGHAVGEAYQICDDIADACGRDIDLGKTAGQDRRHGRFSIVGERGPAAAWEHAASLIRDACRTVYARFGDSPGTRLLEEFANGILVRGFELVKFELVR
jgi:farnesyl diphosphate synthase